MFANAHSLWEPQTSLACCFLLWRYRGGGDEWPAWGDATVGPELMSDDTIFKQFSISESMGLQCGDQNQSVFVKFRLSGAYWYPDMVLYFTTHWFMIIEINTQVASAYLHLPLLKSLFLERGLVGRMQTVPVSLSSVIYALLVRAWPIYLHW